MISGGAAASGVVVVPRTTAAIRCYRAAGTSDFYVKDGKTRGVIYRILLGIFAFFYFWAPKREDAMRRKLEHEKEFYADYDSKYILTADAKRDANVEADLPPTAAANNTEKRGRTIYH